MATLELYINKETGAFHNFVKVEGTRRSAPEGDFKSQSIDTMMRKALELLEGDNGYDPRLRIYDFGRKMIRGGDGISWFGLELLQRWLQSQGQREPQVNEAILGKRVA